MSREKETQDPAAEPTVAEEPADDASSVGYGRPPHHSRFRLGRSGNPKGRPKGSRSLKAALVAATREKVTIRTATGPRKITKLDAFVQKTINGALNGDAASSRLLVSMLGSVGLATDMSDVVDAGHASHIREEDKIILARYLAQQSSEPDAAPDPGLGR